jgi:HK97 family phage portal protein
MGIFSNWFQDNTEIPEVSVYQIGSNFDIGKTEGVIEKGYISNGDVYSIVKKIADNAKHIPRELWKKEGDEWEMVTEGDLFDIVTKRPNDQQNIHDFIEQSVTNLLTKGNTFRRGRRTPGFGEAFQEIIMVNNNIITIDCMVEDFNYIPKQYKLELGKNKLIVPVEDMNHVKFYNPSDYGMVSCLGLSPLQAGLLSLVASNDNKTAQSVLVRNQGIRGLITSRSERAQTPEERNQIQQAADNRMMGASKFGKAIATSANVDFIQMGMDATQLKIIESAVMKLRDLCNLYGVDSSLFNDPANKTYNNRKEAEKAMFTNAVIPVNEKDIHSLSQWLLPGWNEKDNTTYEIRQNLSSIPVLHEDEDRRAAKQEKVSKIFITILEAQISNEQKVFSLMRSLDYSEDEAKEIVGNETQEIE